MPPKRKVGVIVVQRVPVARGIVPQRSGGWCCVQRLLFPSKRQPASSLICPLASKLLRRDVQPSKFRPPMSVELI